MAQQRVSPALPGWVQVVTWLGALLMAAGGAIALVHPQMLVSPADQINGAVRIYAGYLASRNFAVAAALLLTLLLRARGALGVLMMLTALIQIADVAIDCFEGRWSIVPGVTVLGLLFFLAAARVSGYPFWSAAAWRAKGQ